MSKVENKELMETIEEFVKLDEKEEKDLNKLAEIGHELDHQLLDCELIAIVNSTPEEDYNEILRLIVEDDKDSYFIPAFTDIDEAKIAIKELGISEDEMSYEFEAMTGLDILEIAIDDDNFVGIVVNPYDTDFIFPKEDLVKTAICKQEPEGC